MKKNNNVSLEFASLKQGTLRVSFVAMSRKHVGSHSRIVLLPTLLSLNVWTNGDILFDNGVDASYSDKLYINYFGEPFNIESFGEFNKLRAIKQFDLELSLTGISSLSGVILDLRSYTDLEVQGDLLQLFNFDRNKA